MSLKPRYYDLLAEFRERHAGLWHSLALLDAGEWQQPLGEQAPAVTGMALLAERIAADRLLAATVEAAAVGLDAPQAPAEMPALAAPAELPVLSAAEGMDLALAVAETLDAQLAGLDNHQWQRKVQRDRGHVSVAELVDELNAGYSRTQNVVDRYLGSYDRLGSEGLKRWLLDVYDELMGSISGMTEAEIMGPAWYGEWNTYQLLEHVWAWNEQLLEAAKRWQEPDLRLEFQDMPTRGKFNPYLNAAYEGNDMVAVADGIVTVCRKTVRFIDRAGADVLCSENNYPWPQQGPLCNLIFEVYRHAWSHAGEIRQHHADQR